MKDTLEYTKITYFENGKIKTIVDFHDGHFNGRIIENYQNGNKKFEGTTTFGDFYGSKTNYYEDGKIKEFQKLDDECKAQNCLCDGEVIRFYPNGDTSEKFTMKSGHINGLLIENLQNKKIRRKETNYLNDIKNGLCKEYHDSFIVIGYYKNGKENGVWKFIDSTGKILQTDIYREGKLMN